MEKNILLISPVLPHKKATHGGGVFLYRLFEKLSRKYRITLVCRVFKEELSHIESSRDVFSDIRYVVADKPFAHGVISLFRTIGSYVSLANLAGMAIREYPFDIVQVEYAELGFFMRIPSTLPSALTLHDVLSKPYRRRMESSRGFRKRKNYFTYQLIRMVEKRVIKKFRSLLVLSEFDRDLIKETLEELGIQRRVTVIPFIAPVINDTRDEDREQNSILFLGAMNRPLNVRYAIHFYESIFPLIKENIPGATFIIAGNGPPESIIDISRRDSSVTVTGYIDEPSGYYRRAAVFVAPIMIGGGIIIKIVEAMAHGVPVVTTSIGNEGINAENKKEIFVADTADEFADKVCTLLNDTEMSRNIGEKGKRFVENKFSLHAALRSIEQEYDLLTPQPAIQK